MSVAVTERQTLPRARGG